MRQQRQILAAATLTFVLGSSASQAGLGDLLQQGQKLLGNEPVQQHSTLDSETLGAGLKEALRVGTERAVDTLAQPDGYLGNADVRIELPGFLHTSANMLRRAGLSSQVDAFERSMNRAAESAVTEAAPIFADAITAMTLDDAQRIYNGGDTAATDYFRDKTWQPLRERFKPRVEEAMRAHQVTASYETLLAMARSELPLLGNVNLNLADHVTGEALDGLFLMLAREEKKIREQPLARTTDLLRQVFSN
jgi:hypothetical protein